MEMSSFCNYLAIIVSTKFHIDELELWYPNSQELYTWTLPDKSNTCEVYLIKEKQTTQKVPEHSFSYLISDRA